MSTQTWIDRAEQMCSALADLREASNRVVTTERARFESVGRELLAVQRSATPLLVHSTLLRERFALTRQVASDLGIELPDEHPILTDMAGLAVELHAAARAIRELLERAP